MIFFPSFRLAKIRKAMEKQPIFGHGGHQCEITVKTKKGEEFKFGGISDKFTRKLFEWEERRGIAPESSTIALLNPDFGVDFASGSLSTDRGELAERNTSSSNNGQDGK